MSRPCFYSAYRRLAVGLVCATLCAAFAGCAAVADDNPIVGAVQPEGESGPLEGLLDSYISLGPLLANLAGLSDSDGDPQSAASSNSAAACPANATRYTASSAVSDSAVHSGNHNHSIWLPRFFCNQTAILHFESDATLDLANGGGATLSGTAVVASGGCGREGERWQVEVQFRSATPGTVLPKRELKNPNVNQSPAVTNDWIYFIMQADAARMSQIDGDGFASFTHRPANLKYGFQVGETANGKNASFGASGWMEYAHQTAPAGPLRTGVGDFNLDLAECETPPEPPPLSYVAWGTDACSAPDFERGFAGYIHVAESFAGNINAGFALSNLFCSPTLISTPPGFTNATGITRVQHFRNSSTGEPVPCAVCVR